MAATACPKCGGHSFENQTIAPRGSNFNLTFIQCASCGTVVGVMDFRNIGQMLMQQQALLERIAQRLGIAP